MRLMPIVSECMWLYCSQARLLFSLTVDEGEVLQPVYKELKLATDAESDEEKPHLDIGAVGKS